MTPHSAWTTLLALQLSKEGLQQVRSLNSEVLPARPLASLLLLLLLPASSRADFPGTMLTCQWAPCSMHSLPAWLAGRWWTPGVAARPRPI